MPQGAIFFNVVPSSSDTLEPSNPKFGTRVHVSKSYPNMHNLVVSKIKGVIFYNFWDFLLLPNSS